MGGRWVGVCEGEGEQVGVGVGVTVPHVGGPGQGNGWDCGGWGGSLRSGLTSPAGCHIGSKFPTCSIHAKHGRVRSTPEQYCRK